MTVERLNEVAMQMKPEESIRLDPVLNDIAQETLDLVDDDSLSADQLDDQIGALEKTVSHLVKSLQREIEPEATL